MFFFYLSVSIIAALISSAVFTYLWRRKLERDMQTRGTFKKLKNEINDMLTDINGATERNILLIEDKIRTMSSLINRGDKLASVLKKEKEKQRLSGRIYSDLGKSRSLNLVLENANDEFTENGRIVDVERSDKQKVFEISNSERVDFQSLSTQEKILVLFRKGESVERIASVLGISRGEIELTISIHDRRD